MTHIKQSLDVDAPLRTVYNQFTQFESFPRFMEGPETVKQMDDRTVRFTAKVGGVERTWVAVITEQAPDQVIRWRTIEGEKNDGEVRFQTLAPEKTRIEFELDHKSTSTTEAVGAALGVLSSRVRADLVAFKRFVEERGVEEGGWRGEIHAGVAAPQTQ